MIVDVVHVALYCIVGSAYWVVEIPGSPRIAHEPPCAVSFTHASQDAHQNIYIKVANSGARIDLAVCSDGRGLRWLKLAEGGKIAALSIVRLPNMISS